jgi:hypothetical protein
MVGAKDQSIRPVQIERQLPVSVPLQFMTPARQVAHYFEICGSAEIVQPPAGKFCALQVELPDEASKIIAIVSEPCVLELDVHRSPRQIH